MKRILGRRHAQDNDHVQWRSQLQIHYDENNDVTYETEPNNQIVATYTYRANNDPVSMTRGGKTYYYQTTTAGDVTALTDSTGAVVAS
ncbi:hypothetical protein SAMN05421790_104303 [Kroppenstedtia eburnea]|uniref:YD repeat-containing protein n=1 Tax=Kroppenstedtia eburnea TaxID=714067 RepID=A0A1N7LP70_9BACL|nr:hypothetical protein SAMN05421790_104303 [Kroppenstedtia eburnea]